MGEGETQKKEQKLNPKPWLQFDGQATERDNGKKERQRAEKTWAQRVWDDST